MASEFERIARIQNALTRPSDAVLVGIGDDCAVLAESPFPRVWTVDAAIDGVHFARDFMPLEAIGYRAFMAAASDIAAMGARAVAALSALVLPRELSDADLDRLTAGLAQAADLCACPIVGGNLARGAELSITTSVLGEARRPALLRRGARPGDDLFVTGNLGGAALGLEALRRELGEDDRVRPSVQRFLRPRARLDLSDDLAQLAHACIDISDGLVQDLSHLCQASGVRAVVELARLPVPDRFAEGALALGLDPHRLLLAGGEDYELLFTAGRDAVPAGLATCIGHIAAGAPEIVVLDAAGQSVALPAGFDHFR